MCAKQFAIRACKGNGSNAVEFSKPKGKQKYGVLVRNATIANSIRNMVSWEEDNNWNVPDILCAEQMEIFGIIASHNKSLFFNLINFRLAVND